MDFEERTRTVEKDEHCRDKAVQKRTAENAVLLKVKQKIISSKLFSQLF